MADTVVHYTLETFPCKQGCLSKTIRRGKAELPVERKAPEGPKASKNRGGGGGGGGRAFSKAKKAA